MVGLSNIPLAFSHSHLVLIALLLALVLLLVIGDTSALGGPR